jgi:putative transposase
VELHFNRRYRTGDIKTPRFNRLDLINLIRNHPALAFESLNVKEMSKAKLSRSIHDTALGEIKRQAEYKGLWYDVPFIQVDRWFPSSKLCSACGYKNNELSLSAREWRCPACETHHDRDINAAQNVRPAVSVISCQLIRKADAVIED